MPEITALIRASLARHRWLLLAMVASIGVGVCIALITVLWFPGQSGEEVAIQVLFLTLMPAGIASIVLFDYGLDQDLILPESGCSHWILRMPIRAWKIAMVPVVLKSFWISGLWVLLVLFARAIGAPAIPVFTPCVVFSAISIWIMVISWRPFQSAFRRMALLLVAIPILYCALLGSFATSYLQSDQWRTVATVASVLLAISLYIGGAWFLIRSTQLARVSPGGITPAQRPRRPGPLSATPSHPADETPPIRYRSSLQALFYHDMQKTGEWIRRLYAIVVVPSIVIFALLIPMQAPSVVAALFLFGYFAGFAGSRAFANANANANSLPVYLATSPLSTKRLAWSRQIFPFVAALGTYLCILFLIAGWTCWESNRETWMQWAEAQSSSLGGTVAPTEIGLRLSTAIVLGVGILFLGRMAAFSWVGMTGRSWVALVVTIVASLAFLIPAMFALRWFLKQTDWESTQASLRYALTLLPTLIGGLLLAKAIVVVVVSIASTRQHLITAADLFRVSSRWAVLVVTLAVAFYLLLPYAFVTLTWCLAFMSLAIPLGRILALPLAVSWDRHR